MGARLPAQPSWVIGPEKPTQFYKSFVIYAGESHTRGGRIGEIDEKPTFIDVITKYNPGAEQAAR